MQFIKSTKTAMARYISIALLILLTACQASDTNKSPSLPNIIFILADDMGYGDIRALNPDSKITTPHMDRIAHEGIHFTDAHSPSAVCTPTRYGLLTGRYCFRSRLQSGVLVGHSPSLIEPGKLTVASLLKQSGYATGCIGKWHLGLDFRKKDSDRPLTAGEDWSIESTDNVDYTSEVHGGPCDHGFDYSFILPSSLDIQPYLFISNQQVVEPETEHIEEVREGRGLFWRYGDASKGFDFWQVLPVLTNKATDFIKGHHQENPGQPFFLYFPLTAPHTPWVPADEFKGTSEAGDYGDFVTQVDHTVGQVLALIDSLNSADNTLIMVSSDNGSHWMPDDINRYDHRA
ncbi:MAG: sulfatase-like hydrolase/transferase, partial [Bacteroidales bacterium]|nr:sulfatase-like hydrolase/transferase [Bacteroidales bacterium]